MTIQMLTVEQANGLKCCFEEWKQDRHHTGVCGGQAITVFGKAPLCIEHTAHALACSGSLTLLGEKPAKGHPCGYATKDAFMVACRKEWNRRAAREKEAVNG
jgi:hypothetical protein